MSHHLEIVHHEGHDPTLNMPYVPAIRVRGGATGGLLFGALTAAPRVLKAARYSRQRENLATSIDPPIMKMISRMNEVT